MPENGGGLEKVGPVGQNRIVVPVVGKLEPDGLAHLHNRIRRLTVILMPQEGKDKMADKSEKTVIVDGKAKAIVGSLEFRGDMVHGSVDLEAHDYAWKVDGREVYNPLGPSSPKRGGIWQGILNGMRIQVTVMPTKDAAPDYVRDCEALFTELKRERNPAAVNLLAEGIARYFTARDNETGSILEKLGVSTIQKTGG